ncbi:hypothetical protein [Planctomycetes bacterium K23_9]|uniref:EF hand n=1 Tax=Stieleria marina TaxID=1930275 RepID=A0A517NQ99_9BACT|nr:EF hand [Planctomycetes bacterium K23_9]
MNQPLRFFRSLACLACISIFVTPAFSQDGPERRELMKLELIPYDLKEATRTMTVYDRDDNGAMDQSELERLQWSAEAADFDLDKNGELTHLEVGIRQAYLRSRDDITEADINNVNMFLSRYDKNRNGQLDQDEVQVADLPAGPDEFDSNRDGIITARELAVQLAFDRVLRSEMGIDPVDQNRANRVVKHFDTDADKRLSTEEASQSPLPKPASEFDEDDDQLSLMELATMYAVHRRDMGLSKFDTKKVHGIFVRHDPDGDGKILIGPSKEQMEKQREQTEKQFGKGAKVSLAESPLTLQLKNTLGKFDANKDNVVTIAEVEARLAEIRKGLGYAQAEYQKARQLITRYDSDRSKHIETAELDAAVSAGQLPKNLFAVADANKDGKITLEELAAHFGANK